VRRLYPRLRNPITSFTGKHDFLALDYPVSIVYKRKTYPSVAAVMKSEKARLGDVEYRKQLKEILALSLHHKFTEHDELQDRLLDTGEDDIVTTPAIVGELLTLLRDSLAAEDEEEEDDEEEDEEPTPRPAARPAGPAPDVKRRRVEHLEAEARRLPGLRVLWPDAPSRTFRVGRKTAYSVQEAFTMMTPRGKKRRREWEESGMAAQSLRSLVDGLALDRNFRQILLSTKNYPLTFRNDLRVGNTAYSDLLVELRDRVRSEDAGRARLAETSSLQPGRERREGEDVVARLRGLGFRF
jgi:hypothetical protein